MNLLKLCCLLALSTVAVTSVSAQTAVTTSRPPSLTSSSSSSFQDVAATKAELEAMIKEIKQLVAKDPSLAAIFEKINLDELLTLTPEQAREKLNALVFKATAAPTRNNSTSNTNSTGSSNKADGPNAQAGDVAATKPVTTVPVPPVAPAKSAAGGVTVASASMAAVAAVVLYGLQD